ncbi:testis-expressed protein 33 isoform X2 [Denticeps clupeoides]|uniref:testis-expressed protein 33 isoform X2 n=1 Tax=Denticeps clupeoides TaxID=299321 RepID=UPI0010A43281|nr:testis-expressed protein 33 isoform X2 [Denticeps clupeoides]
MSVQSTPVSTELEEEQAKMRKLVPFFEPPHYQVKEVMITAPHAAYHSLSHCLRADIFPGAPLMGTSLVKESYVAHPVGQQDPEHWYGRKADDMVRWSERNFLNRNLTKALKERKLMKGTAG